MTGVHDSAWRGGGDTANDAFLDTLEDLRRRTHLRATPYDMSQAAGLVRRLLLDGQPLAHAVNRLHRQRLSFTWGTMLVARPARNGLAWVSGIWLDPSLLRLRIETLDRENIEWMDGPSDWDNLLAKATSTGPKDAFWSYGAVARGKGETNVSVSVREVVDFYANNYGGVHWDPRTDDVAALLADVLAESSQTCGRPCSESGEWSTRRSNRWRRGSCWPIVRTRTGSAS